jgi:dienelactone hydrolase
VAWLSDNPLHEAFATRALFLTSYGGADFGECAVTVERVGADGDDEAWLREWRATADGLVAEADESAAAGHRVSAREAYLRAVAYYRCAYQPLFGAPTDARLRETFELEQATLAKATSLWDRPVELVEIPFEDGTTLPGVFARVDDDDAPRPTIVHVNGYDSNVGEMFVAHVPAALERGYNILLFDGPGQGRNLIRDGVPMRPDWESVVRPVVDDVLGRPGVDAGRIVLAGWSWGGYLAPRAAAFEERIAALWADPGQWDQAERLPPEDQIAGAAEFLAGPDADPLTRWRLVQRGCWVHGVPSLADYFADLRRYELSSVAGGIRCPSLVTMAEGDPVGAGAKQLHDAIGADRKVLMEFTLASGAGGHCEGLGRRRFHQRCYDWLDETLAVG